MKLTKRITALVLSLVMLVTLVPKGIWPAHVHAAEEPSLLEDLHIVYINPLYADIITEDDLVKPNSPLLYADNTADGNYYSASEAGKLIRDDLVARDATITVNTFFPYTTQEEMQQNAQDHIYNIMANAMAHTGNPVEGDYLLWQFAGFSAETPSAKFDESGKYVCMTLTYTMTYYTSAAQEAEMAAAVAQVLNQLNVSDKDEYTKLAAIYNYITSNVTYDHDNASNNNYTLKHTAYAALINKTSVCQGFALLLYRLALELGIDCRLIPGDSYGQGHGWNIAKIGDLYYNLDATWDEGLSPAQYQYFLKGALNFPNHDRWDKPGQMPSLDSYNSSAFHEAYPMSDYNFGPDCDHTFTSEITTPATCTEKGVKTFTCTQCGSSYTETTPSTGHNYDQSVITDPTCTEKGYTTHICTACGDSYQDTLVEATGHSYDSGVITKETSCTEPGELTYTCSTCQDSYTEQIPMIDHVYDKSVVTAPTCTEKGYTTHTCSSCGSSYQDTYVDATGHSYDDGVTTKAATCTETGVKTYTCSACNHSYTEEIPLLAHVYSITEVTAPTCSEQGYTTHTCSVCGNTYQDSIVDATGHNYVDGVITTEPTCTETGVMTYTCSRCSGTIAQSVAALGHAHDDGKITIQPTCTEAGEKVHICVRCGDTLVAIIDATGHTFGHGTVTVAPTCLETGIMTYTCTVCRESETEVIPLADHTYEGGVCTVCGDVLLATPEILSCYSKEQTSVKVTWSLVDGAKGYELWRTATPDDDKSWTRVKTIKDGTVDRYTNQGLTEGVTYFYVVRAYTEDAQGQKVYSNFSNMSHMPAAVVWNGPYSNATFRVRLLWNEINGAHGYQIWKLAEDGKTWTIVKTLGDKGDVLTNNQGATTAYSHTGLVSGENYTYKMRAFMITEDGRKVFGAYSDEFTVAVMPETPVVSAVSPKAGRVQLSWNAINGAAGYQVWMYQDGVWSIAKSVTDGSISYTKYDLQINTSYNFRVRAYTEVDGKKTFGAYSEIVSAFANGALGETSGTCGKNLTWTFDNNGTLTISGTGAMYDYSGETSAPWIKLPITKVVVESGVTSIGDWAFAKYDGVLDNFTEISLPDTLREIGYRAFSATKLQTINIPASVKVIEDCAFYESALTTVTLPAGITQVNNSMFAYCPSLKEVVIPEGITALGDEVFIGCSVLEYVTLPSTLKTIGVRTFKYCIGLEAVVLPDSVTSIGQGAFQCCYGLQAIYLSAGITVIPEYAFDSCNQLVEVYLPAALKTIESNAFRNCTALTTVYYLGEAEQLAEIGVYEGNDYLLEATVYLIVMVLEQPEDTTVKAGEKVTFHVAVSRDNVNYQWYYLAPGSEEWQPCTQKGAQTDTLTFTATEEMDGYYFLCEISDEDVIYGNTEPALLTVN